jgi:hypothetical protein
MLGRMRKIVMYAVRGAPILRSPQPGDEVHLVGVGPGSGNSTASNTFNDAGVRVIEHPIRTGGVGNKQRDTYRRLIREHRIDEVWVFGISDTGQAIVACCRKHGVRYVEA